MNKNKISLINIACNLGGNCNDVINGPEEILKAGLIEKINSAGFNIENIFSVISKNRATLSEDKSSARYMDEIVELSKEVSHIAKTELSNNNRILGIGGDHSVNLGLFSGFSSVARAPYGLIYIDAHGDINTDITTPTGNIHGMHLASLLGLGPEKLTSISGKFNKLKPSNLFHIGGSDLELAEINLIKDLNIKNMSLLEFIENGLKDLENKINDFAKNLESVWVSIDLDSINKEFAPGVAIQNRLGFNYREIYYITKFIGRLNNIVGVDIVEYSPEKDIDKRTAYLAIELIANLFGGNYSEYSEYLKLSSR